jgi:restriction endonuclease S subunit
MIKITKSSLLKLEIILPPLLEQCKIAEVLGVWDESIDLLERLIGRVRSRKQGLMQQLLTGKKRFKEFEGSEWEMIKVGDIFSESIAGEWGEEVTSLTKGIPIIRSTNFTKDGKITLIKEKLAYRVISNNKLSRILLNHGELLLEKSGGSPDQPVGRVVIFEGDSSVYGFANFLQKLVVKDSFIPKAIYYFLHHFYLSGKVMRYQQQTTGIINFQLSHFLNTEKNINSQKYSRTGKNCCCSLCC